MGRDRRGLWWALVSSCAFGGSGSLARGLFDSGWSPAAVVTMRVAIGAAVVLPLGVRSLGGDWSPLRRNFRLVIVYGLLAVAAAQYCFFEAVKRMDVGPALLIEFTAPAGVVAWMWLRHGQRPPRITVVGALVCAVGLLFVLDVFSGTHLSIAGVAWASAAMIGCSALFVVNGNASTGLPPLALASAGLLVGAVALGTLGAVGLLRFDASADAVELAGATVPWWLPAGLLGSVSAGLAYVAAIAAGRHLGSRLASFVSLLEVIAGIVFAWALVDQVPTGVQVVGAVVVLAGLVVVRLGETSDLREVERPDRRERVEPVEPV